MASTDTTAESVDVVLRRVLELSVTLHRAIAHFDEPGARYELAGVPGVAFFERDGGDTISHASSSPSPALVPALDDLRRRHLHLAGVDDNVDNSHVPPLLLLCLMLTDEQAGTRFELHDLVRKPTQVVALDEEDGRHDPDLQPHDAAMRAWVPLVGEHAPAAGMHPAILELRFHRNRNARYAPW